MTNENDQKDACCPKFNPEGWDNQEVNLRDRQFVKGKAISFLYMPLNMGSMMKKMMEEIKKNDAEPSMDKWLMLSNDVNPWKSEHFIAVSREVDGMENVKLSGKFYTKVFEGPYKNAKDRHGEMINLAKEKGMEVDKVYFYYTTCPKCAKKYGKNYVVGYVKVK
ncbi:MAG: hypothetical protein HQ538_04985 [Parcubacteria group bacterium]|nr:hypothetical protein [Parcubacteria group bacterium]